MMFEALGLSAFTIWAATTNFIEKVIREKEMNQEIILSQIGKNYDELVNLVDVINEMWSGLSFWIILDICTWISVELDLLLSSTNWFHFAYVILLSVYLGVALLLSAECSRKVSTQCIIGAL